MRLAGLVCILYLMSFGQMTQIVAQWRGPQLSHLGPAEGLPAFVNAMTQDSTGYLYFGTNTGLYRYDGHSFDYYGHDPLDDRSIGSGDVLEVFAGRDGLIWIGLRFGGLNSFDPKTGKFRRFPIPDLPFKSVPLVQSIYEDDNNDFWVGSSHFRLFKFDRELETFEEFRSEGIDPQEHGGRLTILSIAPDVQNAGIFWLSVLDYKPKGSPADSYGLISFNRETGMFSPEPCFGRTKYIDSLGVLWGTSWGNTITRFDPARDSCSYYQFDIEIDGNSVHGRARDLIRYQNTLIVAGGVAILQFNPLHGFKVWATRNTRDQEFNSLFIDRDQNLWIGANQGVSILSPGYQHIRFFSLSQFGAENRIYPGRLAHYAPENTIYLSQTSNAPMNRIYKIPLGTEQQDAATYLTTPGAVHGIATDYRNRIWVCTAGSLYQLDPSKAELMPTQLSGQVADPIPWIWNMKSNNTGWVGAVGDEEFIWFHSDRRELRRIHMDAFPGSSFAKSFDNNFDGFSFGSDSRAYLFSNEVFCVDLNTGQTTALLFPAFVNPTVQHFQSVCEDPQGFLWISSVEMVGQYLREGDSLSLVQAYTTGDGMISPLSKELCIDPHDRVWAFTDSGINCIDPETQEVRFFSTKEGLPTPFNDPRQVITIGDSAIATVSSNGLIVFDPRQLWESVAPTNEPVVIKQIRIRGEQLVSPQLVNNLDALYLKPGENLVDIEFQALSYPTDYRMEYSYRIRGLQEEWISIGQNRFVTLPSLSPGAYRFEVKAGSPLSDAPVKSLAISVATPIYLQTWFIILSAILLAGIIVAIMQWRIKRIRSQEAARTEVNKKIAELELKALRAQMNPHFMFNSLNSIKNYILHAEPQLAAEYLSNFSHLIRMILQNSREKSITLQEELETLTLYIDLEKLRFDDGFDFSCSVENGIQLDRIMIPPMLLQPYVENAIWHGLMHKKEPGHLCLSFEQQNGMIACTIEDDGVGRESAKKMKSFSAIKYKSMGMGINRDRIDIMNKMDALGITIEITDKYDESGNASGTRVTLLIPGPNNS